MPLDPRTAASGETVEERHEAGRAARSSAPRSAHAEWAPAADRPDPVAILQEQASRRLADLVPLRHGRMLTSAFAFYRGGAAIMAADLAPGPASGMWVQACGDAHLSNFGGYASPARRLVFDVNDFDETLPGPWEWDVKRLAASFEIGGRDRDFGRKDRRLITATAVREYRLAMRRFAKLDNLDLWYRRLDVDEMLAEYGAEVDREDRDRAGRTLEKARLKDRMRAFAKLTTSVDGKPRIAAQPPLITPIEDLVGPGNAAEAEARIRGIIAQYRETLRDDQQRLLDSYQYVHAARKVVGVGSVGTRAWVALLIGRDERDPLFLQVKEAEHSVLEPFTAPPDVPHQGARVVRGQRLMQATGDILLGWTTAVGIDGISRDFYVRQLWDEKASARIDRISSRAMLAYAQMCGATLARAHARSGDRVAIAAYLGGGSKFDEAITAFASAYADQNERDYDAVRQAVRDGRLESDEVVE